MGKNIKKISLVILVIFANVALSVTPDCSEITETYELTLKPDDQDVLKLARDSWNLLVSSGKNRGALKFINLGIEKAQVQVVGSERRYTILLQYDVGNSMNFYLNCYLFVWTDHSNINFIDCWPGFPYGKNINFTLILILNMNIK
ncbi:hypothetical protein KQX54_003412 [Cotesia glomerata]|uniref:Uncharacterized protein n=1 Tax=Cotesia glomerata TaxID=32391 RepID=A0AAV7IJQ2_COTGL|nr:hypothetical protein KQX54_003412 [Cotesia glomerata]